MENSIIESTYPVTFREKLSEEIGQHLKNRHSLVLIGMRRVGISNFLRFFLYNKQVPEKYIKDGHKHLFIPVDLNDLVEREIYPFWMLTLKRIVDSVQESSLNETSKKQIQEIFLDCIQSKNLFLLIDGVRRSLNKIIESKLLPDIFFIRFDRMSDAATPEFFNNLEGLQSATHNLLSYVFTASRDLNTLSPLVFGMTSLSLASHQMFLKPAGESDLEIIFDAYTKRYPLKLSLDAKKALFRYVGGHVQYLHLALISISEKDCETDDLDEMLECLAQDERIILQSEELWESLTLHEQSSLLKLLNVKYLPPDEKEAVRYIWDTGMIYEIEKRPKVFSPIFENYLSEKRYKKSQPEHIELSKKEHSLFSFMKSNLDTVVEREKIIEAVWPEEEALGVSDWAIDRLVARLRSKLKKQKQSYQIITIKTRGFKLAALS